MKKTGQNYLLSRSDPLFSAVLAKGLANIGWVGTAGGVTSVYVVNTALAIRTAQVESAQAQQTFDNAIAYAYTEYDKDRGVAEGAYRTGVASAEAGRAVGLVNVEGTFLHESATESQNVLDALLLAVSTPWTEFLYYKAEAEKLWAGDFKTAYNTYQSDLSALDTGYAGTTSTAYTDAVDAIAAADLLLANTLSLKAYERDEGVADAEQDYAEDLAPKEEQYATDQAAQAKTYAVALATIARDEAANPAFDEVAAQAAADSQNRAALDGFAVTFGYDQAWFSKLQDVDIAEAQKVFTTAAATATEINARTVADLQTGYATAEADEWKARENKTAALDAAELAETFVTGQADNYATHMATMAAAHVSPWADRERDVAIEEASRVAAEAFAEKTRRQSQAVAERAKEIAAATAAGDLTKADALAVRDKAIAQAAADYDTAEDAAQALVDLAIAGWHRPAGSYSTGLELSGIGHPSSQSEWWRFEVDDYYELVIDFMFQTSSGCGAWNGYGNNAHHLFQEIGDVLQEEVGLSEVPDESQSWDFTSQSDTSVEPYDSEVDELCDVVDDPGVEIRPVSYQPSVRPPPTWRQPPSQRANPSGRNGQDRIQNPGPSGIWPAERDVTPWEKSALSPQDAAAMIVQARERMQHRGLAEGDLQNAARLARSSGVPESEIQRILGTRYLVPKGYPRNPTIEALDAAIAQHASRWKPFTTPWQRQVYQRADIVWDFVRPAGTALAGQTNRAAAQRGYAPVRINPYTGRIDDVVLHHVLDNVRGSVVEMWRSDHTRFHQMIGRDPNTWRTDRPDWAQAWRAEQSGYWRWRTGVYNPPNQPRLWLPGDPR